MLGLDVTLHWKLAIVQQAGSCAIPSWKTAPLAAAVNESRSAIFFMVSQVRIFGFSLMDVVTIEGENALWFWARLRF